jgi:hypothetical protein
MYSKPWLHMEGVGQIHTPAISPQKKSTYSEDQYIIASRPVTR